MSGENPSVSILSGDEVKKVFGQDEIDRLAKEAGVQPDEYADQVSRKLPGEIDKATPQGSIPSVEKAATGAFSREVANGCRAAPSGPLGARGSPFRRNLAMAVLNVYGTTDA